MTNAVMVYNNYLDTKPSTALSAQDIMLRKGKQKLTMLTAYDYTFARWFDSSGVDMILVGDSLGMVMLGRKDTVSVTLDMMIHHTRAVMQGAYRALVIADMPFMTYEQGVAQAMENACRLVQETGVRSVKLEGGRNIVPQIKALVNAGIAVVGHIGLTPQRVATLGGFKVQARTAEAAELLAEDALALQDAGCFAIVLEAIPSIVAQKVTEALDIPTIGIGAGNGCDGQVLVMHDALGLTHGHTPRFVKRYAELGTVVQDAVRSYMQDVMSGAFPAKEHSFSMSDDEVARLKR